MPTPAPQDPTVRLREIADDLRNTRGLGPRAWAHRCLARLIIALVNLFASLRAELAAAAAARAAASPAPQAVAPFALSIADLESITDLESCPATPSLPHPLLAPFINRLRNFITAQPHNGQGHPPRRTAGTAGLRNSRSHGRAPQPATHHDPPIPRPREKAQGPTPPRTRFSLRYRNIKTAPAPRRKPQRKPAGNGRTAAARSSADPL